MPVLVTGFSSVNQLVAAGRAAVKTPEGLEMRAVLLSWEGDFFLFLLLGFQNLSSPQLTRWNNLPGSTTECDNLRVMNLQGGFVSFEVPEHLNLRLKTWMLRFFNDSPLLNHIQTWAKAQRFQLFSQTSILLEGINLYKKQLHQFWVPLFFIECVVKG